jgi:hypothetical protein
LERIAVFYFDFFRGVAFAVIVSELDLRVVSSGPLFRSLKIAYFVAFHEHEEDQK